MDEKVFDTENSISVKIMNSGKEVLIDEDCCTCINIILKNDGRIATSFLGCHNKYIISELQKAQNKYFRSLKKTLKEQRKKAVSTTDYNQDENSQEISFETKDEAKEIKSTEVEKKETNKKETKKSTTKEKKETKQPQKESKKK